jgi:hypothetical protein
MQTAIVREAAVELRLQPGVSRWTILLRTAGVAAFGVVASLPVALFAYFAWPPPTTITEWFTFIQSNRIAAVINLDLVLLIDQLLFVPIMLALYVTLRRVDEPLVLLGTVGSLFAALLLVVSREATFTLPMLSDQYVAATTDTERALLLAAGQTLLASFNGTAFSVGYTLTGISGLLITTVMLRSDTYSKTTGYMGVSMYVLALVPPTVGMVGVVLSLVSLVPLVPFQILLGRRFLKLAGTPR